jgi:prolyl-tRNA editing enzyme YbaK/EbsC (Cys-tRNA(Pro) deacylase)
MSNYHQLTTTIQDLLQKNNYWFEKFEHVPVRTSEEAAQIRTGYTLHQGAKALIVRIKQPGRKFFVMLVIPGDAKFSKTKVAEAYQSKDIRFATPEEVSEITHGVLPGGVPPFGNLFELEVTVDPSVLANEKIIFNAADRAVSIAMLAADYQKLVQPQISEIVE